MCTILDFLNHNSAAIQAIMVILLSGVTFWYAISSKKMANLMQEEHLLHTRPYLFLGRDVDRFFELDDNRAMHLRFHFSNGGNVPVEYFTEAVTLQQVSIAPQRVNTILFPKQEGALHTNIYIANSPIGTADGLEGSIKIVFWAQGIPEVKYYFKRDFRLAPQVNTFILDEQFGKV